MTDRGKHEGTAQEIVCRLLAVCYYEPGPEFAEERVFENLVIAADAISPDLGEIARRLADAFAADPVEALLVDYTRLFLGPMQALAKPYESVWLSGESTLMQESTLAVLGLYAEGGFELDENFKDAPDHIAAELEFLYLLIFRENEAKSAASHDEFKRAVDLRQRFLAEHLGRWISPFTAAITVGAETAFYRELAILTERFVERQIAL